MRGSLAEPARHGVRGFTLIELLVVIALMAVMTTWAIPAFQTLAERNRLSAEVMRLMGALGQARSAAITQRREAVICPTRDQTECDGDWKLPLMLFIDKDSAPEERATGETLLKIWPASGLASTTYNGFGSERYIRYRANGRPKGQNGTYELCTERLYGAHVIISASGRVRSHGETDCS